MLMQYMLIIGVPSLINPTEQTDSNQPIKNKEVPQQLIENQTENLVFNVFNCCYVCCLLQSLWGDVGTTYKQPDRDGESTSPRHR